MNRTYFFTRVRESLFGGKLSQTQVDGITRVLDYAEQNYPTLDERWLAYILATAKHETAHTMQPVRERGGEKYLKTKPYYPWVGEGLVQVTWEVNHRKFGATKPGQLLEWPIALKALFQGMIEGQFTSRKLADYLNDNKTDFVNARRIVNGTDRAKLIAGYAESFLDAIRQAKEPAPRNTAAVQVAGPVVTGKAASESKTVWAQVGSIATAAGAPIAAALGGVDWKIAAVVVAGGVLAFAIYTISDRLKLAKEQGV